VTLDAYYFRSTCHRYTLRGEPYYWFAVARAANSQHLFGYAKPYCVSLTFDNEGHLTHHSSAHAPELFPAITKEELTSRKLAQLVARHCPSPDAAVPEEFVDIPVALARFALLDLQVGITDVYDPDEHQSYTPGELKETVEKGLYVLWWGRPFWMAGDGTISAT
jgi:hypothetical protein